MIRFDALEMDWLITSSLIDLILSIAFCSELWWARRKLAARSGLMREVVTRLIVCFVHLCFSNEKIGYEADENWY